MKQRHWDPETKFTIIEPKFEIDSCAECGSKLYFRRSGDRCIHTLDSPVRMIRHRATCSNFRCKYYNRPLVSREERSLALPNLKIGWDVFCWIGFRRFKRHWSVPQISTELLDSYNIKISDDAIEDYIRSYQTMVSARHQDPKFLKEAYAETNSVVLSIDGLQPEKGHETLYTIRELQVGRVWFAEPLISSSTKEIIRLLNQVKNWCMQLGVEVKGWVSDKQSSLVNGIKSVFPNVPHRYCHNHFLRDLTKSTTELDSKGKVEMRSKVRGLRDVEREVLSNVSSKDFEITQKQGDIVLNYCSAVRGILNNNKGGPFLPAGYNMYCGLDDIKQSIEKLLSYNLKTVIDHALNKISIYISIGLEIYKPYKSDIEEGIRLAKLCENLLANRLKPSEKREKAFKRIATQLSKSKEKNKSEMGKMMLRFSHGLFSGGDELDIPLDNLDLERWFKNPKGHSRRINGNRHIGTKSVYQGPTLIPTLDAHLQMAKPLSYDDLNPYVDAQIPVSEKKATKRKQVMTCAASKKKRPKLTESFEETYLNEFERFEEVV